MANIRDYINEENVIKDEIFKAFENSVTCSICSDIFFFSKLLYINIIDYILPIN